jgi:hypothetical protein
MNEQIVECVLFPLVILLTFHMQKKRAEASLVGTWNLESSENFDEYMKELGIGFLARKSAAMIKPTLLISHNDDTPAKWRVSLISSLQSSTVEFIDGVEFDEGKRIRSFHFK